MKQVILHIGLHKTGTKSLQRTLLQHRHRLLECGMQYPAISPGRGPGQGNHSQMFYTLYGPDPLAYPFNRRSGIDSSEKLAALQEHYRGQLDDTLQGDAETVVFSGEKLSVLPPESIRLLRSDLEKRAGQPVEFRVMCCVRDPMTQWQSGLSHRVRLGKTIESFYERGAELIQPKFRGPLENFSAVFGAEALDVYKFEDMVASGAGAAVFFLRRLRPDLEIELPGLIPNAGFCHEAITIISYINGRAPLRVGGKLGQGRKPGDIDPLSGLRGEKFGLTEEFQAVIAQASAEDRDWLRRHFDIDYHSAPVPPPDAARLWGEDLVGQLEVLLPTLETGIAALAVDCVFDVARSYRDSEPAKALGLIEFCCTARPGERLFEHGLQQLQDEVSRGASG